MHRSEPKLSASRTDVDKELYPPAELEKEDLMFEDTKKIKAFDFFLSFKTLSSLWPLLEEGDLLVLNVQDKKSLDS